MMEWKRLCWGFGIALLAAVLLGQTGCRPDYPNCETDEHCAASDQGREEGRLYCVNGLCQQCREDADCGDPSLECNAGVCEEIPNYCTSNADCPGTERCRQNRCGPECESDDECGEGQICEAGSCVEEPECSTDADCEGGEVCEDGQCTAADCELEPVYFGYDSSNLGADARQTLVDNAECINETNMSVRIEGHADERGTNEYNISLGESRARSVQNYLQNLGVDPTQMSIISYGEERLVRQCGEQGPETCHRENRRVEFSQR